MKELFKCKKCDKELTKEENETCEACSEKKSKTLKIVGIGAGVVTGIAAGIGTFLFARNKKKKR